MSEDFTYHPERGKQSSFWSEKRIYRNRKTGKKLEVTIKADSQEELQKAFRVIEIGVEVVIG